MPEQRSKIAGDSDRQKATDVAVAPQMLMIGRGTENDVVLRESNVSMVHARLIISDREMVIEDLGSTNGTAVGTVANKINRATVTAETAVYFGSTSYTVAELLGRAARESPVAGVDRQRARSGRSTVPPTGRVLPDRIHSLLAIIPVVAAITVGIVAVAIVSALLWHRSMGREKDDEAESGQHVAQAHAPPLVPPPNGLAPIKVGHAKIDQAEGQKPFRDERNKAVERPGDAADVLPRSLFVIACADAKRTEAFRLGTAFAIDAKHLATSATVVRLLKDFQRAEYPLAIVYNPTLKRSHEIARVRVHPRFEHADAEARVAREQHDAIREQFEASPNRNKVEEIKRELIEQRLNALRALDHRTSYDVAIIELSEPVSDWLPLSTETTKLRPRQKLEVTGYAVDREDLLFDPDYPIELHILAARVERTTRSARDVATRLLAACPPHQLQYSYAGSPVLDAKGNVVAVYSRPTPPSAQGSVAPKPPATCDAATVDRILELLEMSRSDH